MPPFIGIGCKLAISNLWSIILFSKLAGIFSLSFEALHFCGLNQLYRYPICSDDSFLPNALNAAFTSLPNIIGSSKHSSQKECVILSFLLYNSSVYCFHIFLHFCPVQLMDFWVDLLACLTVLWISLCCLGSCRRDFFILFCCSLKFLYMLIIIAHFISTC